MSHHPRHPSPLDSSSSSTIRDQQRRRHSTQFGREPDEITQSLEAMRLNSLDAKRDNSDGQRVGTHARRSSLNEVASASRMASGSGLSGSRGGRGAEIKGVPIGSKTRSRLVHFEETSDSDSGREYPTQQRGRLGARPTGLGRLSKAYEMDDGGHDSDASAQSFDIPIEDTSSKGDLDRDLPQSVGELELFDPTPPIRPYSVALASYQQSRSLHTGPLFNPPAHDRRHSLAVLEQLRPSSSSLFGSSSSRLRAQPSSASNAGSTRLRSPPPTSSSPTNGLGRPIQVRGFHLDGEGADRSSSSSSFASSGSGGSRLPSDLRGTKQADRLARNRSGSISSMGPDGLLVNTSEADIRLSQALLVNERASNRRRSVAAPPALWPDQLARQSSNRRYAGRSPPSR